MSCRDEDGFLVRRCLGTLYVWSGRRSLLFMKAFFGLLVLTLAVSGCQPSPSEKESAFVGPYDWATSPVAEDLYGGDRLVMSPPLGYEFAYLSMPFLPYNRHWVLSSGGQRIRGIEVYGWEGQRFGKRAILADVCERRERFFTDSGDVVVERLTPRVVDGEAACGFRGIKSDRFINPEEVWSLCREDNCWVFVLGGDVGSRSIPGELIAAMETVRFVPLVEEIPDFRLGEASAGAPECPTCSRR